MNAGGAGLMYSLRITPITTSPLQMTGKLPRNYREIT
jgi:hypothetical protein